MAESSFTDMESENTDTQSSETENRKVKSTDDILKLLSQEPWNTRHVMFNGRPYFCATDITKIIGYKNTSQALTDFISSEDRMRLLDMVPAADKYLLSRNEGAMTYLTIDGVKALIHKSTKPEARTLAELLGFLSIRNNCAKNKTL